MFNDNDALTCKRYEKEKKIKKNCNMHAWIPTSFLQFNYSFSSTASRPNKHGPGHFQFKKTRCGQDEEKKTPD